MEGLATTSSSPADTLSSEQRACLHEVADALLRIYCTLVDMCYLQSDAVVRGPHRHDDAMLATYAGCGLDPAIIYLYSIMPYIDEVETNARDFFQGGTFFNQLDPRIVRQGRDPRFLSPVRGFDEQNGQYMYSWFTPLSNCGNHSSIIIYDAREHCIWVLDQIEGHTTDPTYCKGWCKEAELEEEGSSWGDSQSSDWYEDGDDEEETVCSFSTSDGDSEFWADEDVISETGELDGVIADQAEVMDYDEGFEHIGKLPEWELQEAGAASFQNQNSLENVRSRPAGNVLRDINDFYRALKELPSSGGIIQRVDDVVLKSLYTKNGWPDDFNSDQLEVDVARAHATERARYDAEQPLRQVECYERWLQLSIRNVDRFEKETCEARTIDDEWLARFHLWKAREKVERNANDLKSEKEKAEKLCPNGVCQKEQDLPLWQLEKLRVQLESKRESAQRDDQQGIDWQSEDKSGEARRMEAEYLRAQKLLEVYKRAFAASKAEAERLCHERTFQEATGVKSLGRQDTLTQIASQRNLVQFYVCHVTKLREFATIVPEDATNAAAVVVREI